MGDKHAHRWEIAGNPKAEKGSGLWWRQGLKARDPVGTLPPDAQGLVCGVERAWEWAREEWAVPDEFASDPCEDVYEMSAPCVSTSSWEEGGRNVELGLNN